MARYREAVCRFCRREGLKLYLKGERCYTEKCAVDRRNKPPGQHGDRRLKFSDYRLQLREKQKVKRIYGPLEKQFRHSFVRADRMKGMAGNNLLLLLEKRLDNVVYRAGFASSRNQARQLTRHGHVMINKRKVNIPSCLVAMGDEIEISEKSRNKPVIRQAVEEINKRGAIPRWLDVDQENLKATVKELPAREDITMPIDEQLIVELYSK